LQFDLAETRTIDPWPRKREEISQHPMPGSACPVPKKCLIFPEKSHVTENKNVPLNHDE
jgi:hypothetical protein